MVGYWPLDGDFSDAFDKLPFGVDSGFPHPFSWKIKKKSPTFEKTVFESGIRGRGLKLKNR